MSKVIYLGLRPDSKRPDGSGQGVSLSLQSRLFAFFVLIVVVPLAVVSILARGQIDRELERRTEQQLRAAAGAAGLVYQLRATSFAPTQMRQIASDPAFLQLLQDRKYAELQALVDKRMAEGVMQRAADRIDYMIVTAPDKTVLTQSFSRPQFLSQTAPPTAADIVAGNELSRLVTRVELPIQSPTGDKPLATVFSGYYLDNQFVQTVALQTGVQSTFLAKEKTIATTVIGPETSIPVLLGGNSTFLETTIAGEEVYASPIKLADDVPLEEIALVVSAPRAAIKNVSQRMTLAIALLLIFVAILAVVLGYTLTRGITRPLSELAAGADAIAAGNYEQQVEVRSRDEVGKLAVAFNTMAEGLSSHIAQLHESREELKRALTRFGETLRSTHDLEQLLNVIVETSIDHLQAERGLLMLLTPNRDRLVVRVHRGIDFADFELKVGEGLAGHVVEAGTPLRFPDSSGIKPAAQEPKFRTGLMVPIFAEELSVGVLCLFDKEEGNDFNEVDMATLLSLADQAGVAIENVFLHDRARTLSVYDSVVGTWNRRYFHQRMDQELERHARFERPFSLLLVDIDDFKSVNDSYGHHRGDAVLIELVARVLKVIREIDVFARFGGEEFVLLLPETDSEGGVRTAERILKTVAERPFEGQPELPITVSIGVAGYPQHGTDQETLVKAADFAMYQAKREGKDRTVLYEGKWGGDGSDNGARTPNPAPPKQPETEALDPPR